MGQRGVEARKKGFPYHTVGTEHPEIYHVRSDCKDGWDIHEDNLRCGGWDRQLCQECERLIAQSVLAEEARKKG